MSAVAPSVPSATSSPSAPAWTTAKAAPIAQYPGPAVTGPEATGQKPAAPQKTGVPVQWPKSPATGLVSPPRPDGQLGDPAPIPAGSPLPYVQGPVVRGRVASVTGKGRPNTRMGGASGWFRTFRYTLNDVRSQDVDSAGWIQRHPNDRTEFYPTSGAEAEQDLYYWPGAATNNPILTPLAVTGVRTGSSWTPDGTNSAWVEPAPFQATAGPTGGGYIDPAEEWM
jgi:hypothetical protein